MLATVARLVVRRRGLVIGVYAVLVPAALALAGSVLPRLVAGGFEDPERESWQAFEVMQTEFGTGTGDIIALYTAESGSIYDFRVMAAIQAVESRIAGDPAVGSVQSYYSTGARHFESRDGTRTFIVVDLLGNEQTNLETFDRLRPAFAADGLSVQFGGLTPTNRAVFEIIRRDLARAELIALPLTATVGLLIFGSPAAMAVLTAVGLSAILLAFAVLRAIVAVTDVSLFAVNTIMLLGLGLAVDYSLFLISRFREELTAANVEQAIVCTMATTGRAVIFSGATVAASLCGLFAFPQLVLRSLALGGIVVTLSTVVLAVTLAPALLAFIGNGIDKWRIPFLQQRADSPVEQRYWYRMATAAMKRPVVVVALTAVLLLSLAQPFTRFTGTIVDWRVLPNDEPVRITNEILAAEFAPNQGAPHLVLATTTGDALEPDNLDELAALAERLASLPGIARVDSLFTFVTDMSIAEMKQELLGDYSGNVQIEALIDAFVAGPRMRFALIPEQPFDDPRSVDQVHELRAMSTPTARVQVAGYSAALVDLRDAVRDGAPWMIAAVLSISFVVLFLAFNSVVLPVKAMVQNALSLTASFGAIVWIFQDGRLTEFFGYTPLGFSDTTLPLVMFAIVYGLSMDYEVILLSRVREAYARCHDNETAVALGIARTGRLISNAGLLFLLVVAAFSTSSIVSTKALGLGMALAILLDITLVRAMLLPASMALLGRWNWYAPKALRRPPPTTPVGAAGDHR